MFLFVLGVLDTKQKNLSFQIIISQITCFAFLGLMCIVHCQLQCNLENSFLPFFCSQQCSSTYDWHIPSTVMRTSPYPLILKHLDESIFAILKHIAENGESYLSHQQSYQNPQQCVGGSSIKNNVCSKYLLRLPNLKTSGLYNTAN